MLHDIFWVQYIYSVQCTMYNVQCTMYNVQCTMYNVQCTMYNVQCTMYNVQCTMYNVQCTMYIYWTQKISCNNYTYIYSILVYFNLVREIMNIVPTILLLIQSM